MELGHCIAAGTLAFESLGTLMPLLNPVQIASCDAVIGARNADQFANSLHHKVAVSVLQHGAKRAPEPN
jgi:hypothetical protein